MVWAGSVGTSSCATTAITPGSLTSAQYQQSYSYDALNRFLTGPLGTYLYGDSAHLHAATSTVSGYSASYDAAGDLTCRAPDSTTVCGGSSPTGAQLTYDNERRLSHWQNAPGGSPTTQADDLYDGSGARVEERVIASGSPTTTTDYLDGGVEESVNGTVTAKYYVAAGMTLGVNTSSGSTPSISYLASDGLGSVSEALDGNGNATAAQLYTPYGAVRYTTGVMPTSKGFTGQRADATIGLDYYGARYYDPTLGQFASADSDDKGGLNRYGYVVGNPETLIDPTGHRFVAGLNAGGGSGGSGSGSGSSGPPTVTNVTTSGPVTNTTTNNDFSTTTTTTRIRTTKYSDGTSKTTELVSSQTTCDASCHSQRDVRAHADMAKMLIGGAGVALGILALIYTFQNWEGLAANSAVALIFGGNPLSAVLAEITFTLVALSYFLSSADEWLQMTGRGGSSFDQEVDQLRVEADGLAIITGTVAAATSISSITLAALDGAIPAGAALLAGSFTVIGEAIGLDGGQQQLSNDQADQ